MTHAQITAELDRLQALIQPVDCATDQLSKLVLSHEGPLFDAIGKLVDEVICRIAASIGTDYGLLSDWWLTHQFGATPMTVVINGGPALQLRKNADLAELIAGTLR